MSTEVNNLLVVASRKKYRFESGRGVVGVEELWDLSLEAVDKIAVALHEQIEKAGSKSFLQKRAASTTELENKLAIAKFVIETRSAEQDAAKVKAAKQAEKARLLEALANQQDKELQNLSSEELKKRIAELGE